MQTLSDNIYILIVTAMLGAFLLVLLMIMLQIKNRNKILAQRQKMAEDEAKHQKELLHAVIASQEDERKRIGMDIHDEVGTALSALRMKIQQAGTRLGEPNLAAGSDLAIKEVIDQIIQNVRRISHNLSPFVKGAYGLKEALEDIAENVSKSGNIQANLTFSETYPLNFLGDEAQLTVYRVLLELINNTIKHASASQFCISFNKTIQGLEILYEDNGRGIDFNAPQKQGMGLLNIESRLGTLNAAYSFKRQGAKGFGMQINIPIPTPE